MEIEKNSVEVEHKKINFIITKYARKSKMDVKIVSIFFYTQFIMLSNLLFCTFFHIYEGIKHML